MPLLLFFLFTLIFSPSVFCAENEKPLQKASKLEKTMALQKESAQQAQDLQKKFREEAAQRREIFSKKSDALKKMRDLVVKRSGLKDAKEKQTLDAEIDQLKKEIYLLDEAFAKDSVTSAELMLKQSQERLDKSKKRLADLQQNKPA